MCVCVCVALKEWSGKSASTRENRIIVPLTPNGSVVVWRWRRRRPPLCRWHVNLSHCLYPGRGVGKCSPWVSPHFMPLNVLEKGNGFGYYRDVLRMIKLTYYFFPFDSRSHTQAQEVVDWKRNHRAEDFSHRKKASTSTPPLAIETVGARPYG